MNPKVSKFNAWVVYCDIFGFSAYVRENLIATVTDKLYDGHTMIQQYFADKTYSVNVQMISDSIFLVYHVTKKEERAKVSQECISDTQKIMADFAGLKLPLRGSIAYGEVCIGENLLLGDVVLRAVHTEAMIPAPFVLLPKREMEGLANTDIPNRIEKIPIKGDGLIAGVLVHPMPMDSLLHLAREYAERYCTKGPYALAKVWDDALVYINKIYGNDN